jgi:hypothetical protein
MPQTGFELCIRITPCVTEIGAGMSNSVSAKGHLTKEATDPDAITWVGKIITVYFF